VGGGEQLGGDDGRKIESCRARAVRLRLVSKFLGTKRLRGAELVVADSPWPASGTLTLERPLLMSKGPLSLTEVQHPSVPLTPSDSHVLIVNHM
jgi:hypothetical protein